MDTPDRIPITEDQFAKTSECPKHTNVEIEVWVGPRPNAKGTYRFYKCTEFGGNYCGKDGEICRLKEGWLGSINNTRVERADPD